MLQLINDCFYVKQFLLTNPYFYPNPRNMNQKDATQAKLHTTQDNINIYYLTVNNWIDINMYLKMMNKLQYSNELEQCHIKFQKLF